MANINARQFSANPDIASPYIFEDHFDRGFVDTSVWTVMDRAGDSSNSEAQGYDPAHVTVSNSLLRIRADKTPVHGKAYGSGQLQWTSFQMLYGTIEIRALMPGGAGPWPAIWMLGPNQQPWNPIDPNSPNISPPWDTAGGSEEIDIAEFLGGNFAQVNFQVHSTAGSPQALVGITDASVNWHVYKMVWRQGPPANIQLYVDGTSVGLLNTAGVPTTPMFLLLDVAMGGSGGGAITDSTLPQTMLVDYVRVSSSQV